MTYDPRRHPSRTRRTPQGAVVPYHVAERLEQERRRLAQELAAARQEMASMRAAQQRLAQQVRAASDERQVLRDRLERDGRQTEGREARVRALESLIASLRAELASSREQVFVEPPEVTEAAIARLGDAYDSVLRALSVSSDPESAWHEGYLRIGEQVRHALEASGVTLVGAVGERFDPNVHEAVGVVETHDAEGGVVVDVARTGLRREDGRLLRVAQVVVSR